MKKSAGPNWVILLSGLGVTLALVAVLAFAFGRDPRAVPAPVVGTQAPAFALEDLDGQKWTLDQLRGQVVVINFWSTWCLPCREEYALLQSAQTHWPQVRFLGVIYQDEVSKVRAHLKRAVPDPTYPNLIDPGGHIAIDYGVAGVPETYIVDPQGRVVHKQVGPFTEASLMAYIDPLLGAP